MKTTLKQLKSWNGNTEIQKAFEILKKVNKKSLNFEKLNQQEKQVEKIIFAYGVNDWGAKKVIKRNLL